MSSLVLLIPGEKTDLVDLNTVLRERHEDMRAQRDRDIAARAANGSPLDDGINWPKLTAIDVITSINRKDSGALRAAAQGLLDATAGLLEPLPQYEHDHRLDGVGVQCLVLSEKRRRALGRAETLSLKKLREAIESKHDSAADQAREELFDGRRSFVADAVALVQIEGRVAFEVMDEPTLDVLERNDLILPIFAAAVAAQELSPGKASRSGSSPGSTSSASTARTAPSTVAPIADATEAAPLPTRAHAGRPTHAHGGT